MGTLPEWYGIILFFAITIAVSVTCNFFIKRVFIAVLFGTFLAPFLSILITSLLEGFLDPFFQMIFVRTSIISFAVNLTIGILFLIKRGKLDKT
jgi:hypothetical protein